MRNFNHLDVFWENNMRACNKYRRFLECVDQNFLVQVLDKPTKAEALLDLMLTSAEQTIKEVKTGVSLDCSDHILIEFVISRNKRLAKKRSKDPELQESKLFFCLSNY